MKLIPALPFFGLLMVRRTVSQEPFYCGPTQPCLLDTPIPCETFETDYAFQGSCCSLQPISSIKGCRIEVYGGNCFWTPICGECDPKAECNFVYESGLQQACPPSDYDPFNTTKITCPPTPAPVVPEETTPTFEPVSSSAPSSSILLSTFGAASSVMLIMLC